MKVQISIEGMTCGHCVMRVEKALKAVNGVSKVDVSLENKNAIVELFGSMDEKVLKEAVEDAGYDVTEMKSI